MSPDDLTVGKTVRLLSYSFTTCTDTARTRLIFLFRCRYISQVFNTSFIYFSSVPCHLQLPIQQTHGSRNSIYILTHKITSQKIKLSFNGGGYASDHSLAVYGLILNNHS